MNRGLDFRDKERSVICNEQDNGSRAEISADGEQVLRSEHNGVGRIIVLGL